MVKSVTVCLYQVNKMVTIAKILNLYARCGISLIDNGLNEAVLPLLEAENALELFYERKWRVLGGDIYYMMDDGKFAPTYENWSYDGDSARDSFFVARDYLRGLALRDVYIVFVIA